MALESLAYLLATLMEKILPVLQETKALYVHQLHQPQLHSQVWTVRQTLGTSVPAPGRQIFRMHFEHPCLSPNAS
jgi:hypothetical protein